MKEHTRQSISEDIFTKVQKILDEGGIKVTTTEPDTLATLISDEVTEYICQGFVPKTHIT